MRVVRPLVCRGRDKAVRQLMGAHARDREKFRRADQRPIQMDEPVEGLLSRLVGLAQRVPGAAALLGGLSLHPVRMRGKGLELADRLGALRGGLQRSALEIVDRDVGVVERIDRVPERRTGVGRQVRIREPAQQNGDRSARASWLTRNSMPSDRCQRVAAGRVLVGWMVCWASCPPSLLGPTIR